MTSLIYNSFADDLSKGNIVGNADTYYAMLVTSTYTPDKDTHLKRSSVTNEVVGTGYTAGGSAIVATLAKDTSLDQETWTFGNVTWPTSTITARGAVIYKHRGGASSADELVCYIDFGADKTSTAGTFTLAPSAPLTFQN